MSKIFDGDSDSDVEIKTNNEYAKNYNDWRKKEELNRLKTKFGEENLNLLEENASSSSDDDDEGVEWTEEVEKQFFKTLSCLKNKDPRIYDEKLNFFEEAETNLEISKKRKKAKPLYISDYERELLLQKNGELSDSDEQEDLRSKSPTYVEEQKRIKEGFKQVLDYIEEDDDDGEWGGMLKPREKTVEEKLKEEAEYKEWLSGQKEQIEDKEAETELKPLKDYWSNPNLDEGEKFLRDYILKKRFLNKEDDDYIPTYEEIVHDSDKDLSEDEEAIDKQEEFEHKYNFRFEEPDQEFIKRYPRTMEHSLRKTDDKRKLKRAETKERKQKEKEQKMQELKKFQELKHKEIEEKIQKLKEITGNTDIEFKDEDLDGDFDPEAYDRRMKNLFNDEFYEGAEEDQKPEFPELDEYLELENWEKWSGEENTAREEGKEEEYEPHCEDEDFNMDCDYDPNIQFKEELINNTKGNKKRKRKSVFAKAISQPKPVFDPHDKTYEQYLDEYYKFDCEDIIGDIPCKFKYRKVIPNNFGLSIEEILTAKDRELNKWCSLKKAVQHRPDHVEKYDQIAFEKKAKNIELKRKILPSLFENENKTEMNAQNEDIKNKSSKTIKDINEYDTGNKDVKHDKTGEKKKAFDVDAGVLKNTTPKKSKNVKTKKKKKKVVSAGGNVESENETIKPVKRKHSANNTDAKETVPRKKVKKNRGSKGTVAKIGISDARLSAYGINPKKFKNKLKYKKK